MSGKFNGFTKDDIIKMNTANKDNNNVKVQSKQIVKKNPNPSIHTATQPAEQNHLPDETQLSSLNNTLQEAIHFQPLPRTVLADSTTDDSMCEITDSISKAFATTDEEEHPAPSPFMGISLKDYEAQRRMVEEQNKHKKEVLYKAIEQHSERTEAEAKKLKEVKQELNKLENELAADVAILRKQIDAASLLYMQCNKYYEQIETAFLKAKFDLHQAKEKKELLAEHLSIIISNNELRKAKKLTDLMEKVGLSNNDDN